MQQSLNWKSKVFIRGLRIKMGVELAKENLALKFSAHRTCEKELHRVNKSV